MTPTDSDRSQVVSVLARTTRSRTVRFVAGTMAAGLTLGVIAASGGTAAGAATKPLSHSSARFLSGNIGSTSLDTLAGIEGESATYPSNPGANKNSLEAELLNKAIELPLKNGLQIPFPGGIQLGAVAQYAKANKDGSALGATGAVDSNGGIGVGGSKGVPTGGATIDLSNLPGASAITSTVGNVKVGIGAVTARARQVAVGKTVADASAKCTNTAFKRVSDKDQTGEYNIAGLTITAKSPLLATLGTTLTTTLGTALGTLNSGLGALNGLGLPITITGFPTAADLAKDLTISLAGGSITASLTDGSLKIDIAALLKFLGLDIDNLCPNTSLLPYVAQALTKLPAALGEVVTELTTQLTDALGAVTVTIGPVALNATLLAGIINPIIKTVTSTLSSALSTLNLSALQPLIDVLTSSLLNIVVNAQDESKGKLTETALQVNVIPGGGSLSLPTGLATSLPTGLTKSAARAAMAPGITAANKAIKNGTASNNSKAKLSSDLRTSALSSTATKALTAPSADAASDPVIGLQLAKATVGPNDTLAPSPTPTPTATPTTKAPTTSAPGTHVPTGVPAGEGTGGGTPELPLILVLLTLALAAGGVATYRFRGGRASH